MDLSTERIKRTYTKRAKKGGPNPGASAPSPSEGAGAGTQTQEKPLGLPDGLKPPKEVDIILPNGEKVTNPEKKKSHKKKEGLTKKAESTQDLILLVSGLLTALFALAAAKNPIWVVSEPEVKSIAEPAGRILSKLEGTEGLGKYGDGIALVVASSMVIGPRVIEASKAKKGGREQNDRPGNNAAGTVTNINERKGPITGNPSSLKNVLSGSISAM